MVFTIEYLGIKLDVYGTVTHEKATREEPSYWGIEIDAIELTTDTTNLMPFLENDVPAITELCRTEYLENHA
jgi:hypothetical protein